MVLVAGGYSGHFVLSVGLFHLLDNGGWCGRVAPFILHHLVLRPHGSMLTEHVGKTRIRGRELGKGGTVGRRGRSKAFC